MVSHWLIDSSSSAHSSQPREVKNIKHDRYFPQGLERLNPHENYPYTRETCCASCHARRLAQQVALVCGRLYSHKPWLWKPASTPDFGIVSSENHAITYSCYLGSYWTHSLWSPNPNKPNLILSLIQLSPVALTTSMFSGSTTINIGLGAFKHSLRNGDHLAYSNQIHVSIWHWDLGGIHNSSVIPWTSRPTTEPDNVSITSGMLQLFRWRVFLLRKIFRRNNFLSDTNFPSEKNFIFWVGL